MLLQKLQLENPIKQDTSVGSGELPVTVYKGFMKTLALLYFILWGARSWWSNLSDLCYYYYLSNGVHYLQNTLLQNLAASTSKNQLLAPQSLWGTDLGAAPQVAVALGLGKWPWTCALRLQSPWPVTAGSAANVTLLGLAGVWQPAEISPLPRRPVPQALDGSHDVAAFL